MAPLPPLFLYTRFFFFMEYVQRNVTLSLTPPSDMVMYVIIIIFYFVTSLLRPLCTPLTLRQLVVTLDSCRSYYFFFAPLSR